MFHNLTSLFVSTNYQRKMECVDEKAKLTHCESLITILNFTSQAYGCPLCVFVIFARLLPVQDHVIYLNARYKWVHQKFNGTQYTARHEKCVIKRSKVKCSKSQI